MGPLVPLELISAEWNYVIAFVIGISFGFVLERAGFSSSRVLAGVFYGYDFTVLRVFFTAAVTAMLGLLYFNYLGWMDMSLIYVNPTFLYSAIIGGIVMGVGFILGGFCPGTSVCAAAIGKIDAMVFLAGMFIGIFFFAEFYDLFKPLHTGSSLGSVKVFDSIGISEGLFAFGMTAIAIVAFIVTAWIQKRTKKVDY